METTKEAGWTNEAKKALRRIKRKLGKLQTLAIPKEGETLMLCLCQRKVIISSALLIKREGIQILVSYVSRPLQGIEICYTPTEKRVQALIHSTRSLRTIFRKHKVKVVTDGPIEEILKLSGKEGRLAKWATEIRTYDISYIPRKEPEGLVMKKFFGQGEQVEGTPDANKGGTFTLSKKLQAKSNITPRAWRLYVGKEIIEKGLGVGIILVEGSHTPVTKQERKYKKEILDATAPFHRFQITHLLKILNSKAEVLTGLATIMLELLNQEVSVGIKTRPSVEETSNSKKGKSATNAPREEPNYNREASGSN
ncbi:reverse transcriptase domain-containing protein [Tanacetum coccineum]